MSVLEFPTNQTAAMNSQSLVERIRPLLAGQRPSVIGAALADLTAMWIAAHFSTDQADRENLRAEMIELQFDLIRKLIPVNERIILERVAANAEDSPD